VGMRRLIERTYQNCAFPNCARPATKCDLDPMPFGYPLGWGSIL
jgi:hypothetical protein